MLGFWLCSLVFLFLLWDEQEEPRGRTEYVFSFSEYIRKQILAYRTRISKSKRLETHFRASATRSALKEDAKCAVAFPHSRECTKKLISGQCLPRWKCSELAQKKQMSSGNEWRQTWFHCHFRCRDMFVCFVGSATQVSRRTQLSRHMCPLPPQAEKASVYVWNSTFFVTSAVLRVSYGACIEKSR